MCYTLPMDTNTVDISECPPLCRLVGYCTEELGLTVEQDETLSNRIRLLQAEAYAEGLDAALETPSFEDEYIVVGDGAPEAMDTEEFLAWLDSFSDEDDTLEESDFVLLATAIETMESDLDAAFESRDKAFGTLIDSIQRGFDDMGLETTALADWVANVEEESDADAAYVEAIDARLTEALQRIEFLENEAGLKFSPSSEGLSAHDFA